MAVEPRIERLRDWDDVPSGVAKPAHRPVQPCAGRKKRIAPIPTLLEDKVLHAPPPRTLVFAKDKAPAAEEVLRRVKCLAVLPEEPEELSRKTHRLARLAREQAAEASKRRAQAFHSAR